MEPYIFLILFLLIWILGVTQGVVLSNKDAFTIQEDSYCLQDCVMAIKLLCVESYKNRGLEVTEDRIKFKLVQILREAKKLNEETK